MYATSALLVVLIALAQAGPPVPSFTAPAHYSSLSTLHTKVHPALLPAGKRQNADNTCGMRDGKAVKCNPNSPGGGPCCSSYGFCGNGDLYCGDGCQSQFGQCGIQVATIRQKHCGPKHKNNKCSPGECCSANGKCGRSQAFCGKHCQPQFGICHPKDGHKSKPSPSPISTPSERPERCGKHFGNTKCTNGDCCSDAGYCGKGKDFCSVPQSCQRAFGTCDSDASPKGLSLFPEDTPRHQFGKVPYNQMINKCTKPGTVALSFDDGPSNNTFEILDILKAHGAKATFFLSGNTNAKGMIDETDIWIRTIKRIIDEGHQLGSHTWSHPHLNAISRDTRLIEMVRNDRAIANIIGKFPTYMRPPYLECSAESGCLKDMADLGYHVVGWDIDSHDWQESTTLEQMKAHVDKALYERSANDNMFLIQHDHNKHAPELTEYVLKQVESKPWKAVTLGECLDDPAKFWYQKPVYISPNDIAGHWDGSRGCVISEPGFCGMISAFSSKKECGEAMHFCKVQQSLCRKWVSPWQYTACDDYDRICTEYESFCKKCETKDQGPCNSKYWQFNPYRD